MIRNFSILFHIAIRHAFYADGIGRNLVLEPTPDTVRLMQQYALLWRSDETGYFMAYGQEQDKPAALALLEQPLRLRFLLRSTNPYFFNITDTPFLRLASEIFYFALPDNAPEAEEITLLSRAETAGEQDLMPLRAGPFEFSAPGGPLQALRDAQNQIILTADTSGKAFSESRKPYWAPLQDPARANVFWVDLQDLPPGKYGLDSGGQEPVQWLYHAGKELEPGTLGVVEIGIGKNSPARVAPPGRDQKTPLPERQFQLAFQARATRWRYFVINRSQTVYETMEVTDGKTALDFTHGQPLTLRGVGQVAIPLSSNTDFALRERPAMRPKLRLTKKQEGGNGAQSTIDLPTPDWQKVSPEGKGKHQQVYSDMYIYL